ncbi:hypothetical protein PoB_006396800 [Plakobranchus ocellatus]|uniref:Uncharacterized protein n=1 Tax=Plakobranchus ocellatus TaxID=259542 RepID=A0AAV4D091_9GAST|nr:hypothetical protein PoB_006396800 [Plakobranchus ocellatus]
MSNVAPFHGLVDLPFHLKLSVKAGLPLTGWLARGTCATYLLPIHSTSDLQPQTVDQGHRSPSWGTPIGHVPALQYYMRN